MDAMSAAAPREALCVRDLTVRVRATGTVCLDAVTLEARRGEAIGRASCRERVFSSV